MMSFRSRTAILAGAALLMAATAWGEDAAKAKPKTVVPAPVFDAGVVAKGSKVDHDFEIRNEGTGELQIREVRPACGCTVASFDRVVPAGGTGHIHLEMDTTAFNGPIAKSATVLTDDPDLLSLQITMQATVKALVGITPGYARFTFVQGAAPGTISQTLWASDVPDFVVTKVTSPYPYLKATLREATEAEREKEAPGRQWRVELTLQSDAAVGPLKDYVTIETNHPRQREVLVPISGFIRPLLVVTPSTLDFREFVAADRQVFNASFVNYGEDPITIQKVEVTVPGIRAAAQELDAGHRFRITVTMSPEVPKGPFTGTLRVTTSSPTVPVFEAPVQGTAK